MLKLRNFVLLGATAFSLGTVAITSQSITASAKTAIPTRFRHTWEGHGYGEKMVLKMHKYYAYVYEGSGHSEKRYYRKVSKNHYYVLAPKWKTEQGEGVRYVNSHKILFEVDVARIPMYRIHR